MEFLNPWGLLALLALPAVLALHFLRRRHQPLRVATLLLWNARRRIESPGRTVKPPLNSLSLWMQLLAALLLALVLSAPVLRRRGEELVIVLDSAYSLQARAGGRSVADLVRAEARAEIARAGPGAAITIFEHGAEPRRLTAERGGAQEAQKAVATWNPAQPRAAWAATLALLRQRGPARGRVLLLSDRPVPEGAELQGCRGISLGIPSDNLALLAGTRENTGPGRELVRAAVRNFTALATTVEVRAEALPVSSFGAPEREIARQQVKVPAGGSSIVEFEMPVSHNPVRLSIPEDNLNFDNELFLAPIVQRPPRVVIELAAEGAGEIWKRALRAAGEVEILTTATGTPAPELLVTDRPERIEESGAGVVLACGGAGEPVMLRPPFLSEPRHPLLEGVDWGGALLAWLRPQGTWNPPGAVARLSAAAGPILSEIPAQAGLRFLLYADLRRGNLARQPALPLLAHNLLEISRGFVPGLLAANLGHGERLAFRRPTGAGEVCVSQPGYRVCSTSDSLRLAPDRSGLFSFACADLPPQPLALQAADEATSDLRDRRAESHAGPALAGSSAARAGAEFGAFLLLIFMALAGAEWRVAARSTAP